MRNGSLSRLLGDGDLIEVAPGVFRTIGAISMALDATHRLDLGNLNASRLFAFHARFTDGTGGVSTTQLSAVPEAGTFGLLAAGGARLAALVARRRQRSLA